MQKAPEIWECVSITTKDITFSVKSKGMEEVHPETMARSDFNTFMEAGGYPAIMANMLLLGDKTGWKFRKIWNGNIYIDGPSVSGNPDNPYHPIDK